MSTARNARAVSGEDVRAIAELARLRPDEEAVEQLTDELNGILEHIRVLETLDLSWIDDGPADPSRLAGFRDPAIQPDELRPDSIGGAAPDWREGFFVVPRLPALGQGDSPRESAE